MPENSTSFYLMISLNSEVFESLKSCSTPNHELSQINIDCANHPEWNYQMGWKNLLNNVRLLIQPTLLFWLILPWLEIFPNSDLLRGFNSLISTINQFSSLSPSG